MVREKELRESIKELNISSEILEEVKVLHQEVSKKTKLVILSIVLTVLSFIVLQYWIPFFFIAMVIVTLLLVYLRYQSVEKYNDFIKTHVITGMIEGAFEQVHFQPQSGFSKSYIKETEMIEMGNLYDSNDLLTGVYKGVGFTQADVYSGHESTDSEGHTHTHEYFSGRWLIYDFNKEFSGTLQVRSNRGRWIFKNEKPFRWASKYHLEEVAFENPDFNKHFASFSDNPHDAFYLITPHMMESMMRLSDTLNCEVIFGFIDNKLHVGINNGEDAFEVGARKLDEALIKDLNAQIHLIQFIVEGLDLDKDIYKS